MRTGHIERYLTQFVKQDLQEKMVFVGGPRQVGKTTFALCFLEKASENHPAYLNWDNIKTRKPLLQGEIPPNQNLIVFDEIHKFARWRSLIKGYYDTYKSSVSFLVTGSARLDYYSRGGDSLLGRYHHYRLHPFSLIELNPIPDKHDVEQIMKFGGFPEPFLKADERFWRRWQRERYSRVLYEDIRDLENIKQINLLELLIHELPNRVGSPLSIKNLRELLQVAHDTVERWISIFERVYLCFRIPPYGSSRIRAVKKENKLYLTDWSQIKTAGERFENMVACHLLKYCHFIEDTEGYKMELRFLRDTDRREIDFVVLKDDKPLFAVECKSGEHKINPAAYYFRQRTPIDRFYQVHLGEKNYGNAEKAVRVLPFHVFCREVNLC